MGCKGVLTALFLTLFPMGAAQAQVDLSSSVLQDYNGNGAIEVAAFGDSIVRGVGDFTPQGARDQELTRPESEAGFPLRIEQRLGVGVTNMGRPGELVLGNGVPRFINEVLPAAPDVVFIHEGNNDAHFYQDATEVWRGLQTMVNLAQLHNITPVLSTLVVPTADHQMQRPWAEEYSTQIRRLAVVNELPLADVNLAFKTTCEGEECHLLNLPDGLHPNTVGYDVMGEVMLAAALKIDLFKVDGAAQLENVLKLPAGSVMTKPDETPPAS